MPTDCPCGSGDSYDACCGPFHRGTAVAPTAVALMRSRYSAYALSDRDYLLASWHDSTRPEDFDLGSPVEWRRLKIRGHEAGGEGDETGTVHFVAHYWDVDERAHARLEENSRFVREGGRWLYVDSVE